MLPHEFPFRLVETRPDGRTFARLTTGASWARDAAAYPDAWGIEILAQAAIVLLPHEGEGGRGLLAGVDDARYYQRGQAGDTLRIELERKGQFGRLVKVSGRLLLDDETVVMEADLLLAWED